MNDTQFQKIDEQFLRLFKHIQSIDDRLARVEENVSTKDDIRQLTTLI
ncbi:MAG: hypothetical protein WBP12_04345 [Candidatus Saccharimonas sp.]